MRWRRCPAWNCSQFGLTPASHNCPNARSISACSGCFRLPSPRLVTTCCIPCSCGRTRLLRFCPGPASTSTRPLSFSNSFTPSPNRTVCRRCLTQYSTSVASPAPIQFPLRFDTYGSCGARSRTPPRHFRNRGSTGSSSDVWNACDVCSLCTPIPPSSSRFSSRSTASWRPPTTHRSHRFTADSSTSPSSGCNSSSPIPTDSITPRSASCISRPRSTTSLSPSSTVNTPAMHAATYSPMLCPSIACGRIPHPIHCRATPNSTTNNASCAHIVCFSFSSAASPPIFPASVSPRITCSRSIPSSRFSHSQQLSTCSRNTRSFWYSSHPIPTYCAPCPGNKNPTFSLRLCSTTPTPSLPCLNPSTPSSTFRHTTIRRCSNSPRPLCSVNATSASFAPPPAPPKCSPSLATASSTPASLRADTSSNCHSRSSPPISTFGASSTITCAFVPPIPNELTPARLFPPFFPSHFLSSVFTRNGPPAKSIFGFAVW